jgi:aminoglycoside phosphotransferase family enzyme
MAAVHPCSIPPGKSELIATIEFPPEPSHARNYYEIENLRPSEHALLLFTRNIQTNKHIVIKILYKFKDTRYDLETVDDRQLCQLDALHWNRKFANGVHIGLARICDLDQLQKIIGIGEIIKEPTRSMLDPGAEYALLMHELRKSERLDILLSEGNKLSHNHRNNFSLDYHIRILTKYMVYMHTELTPSEILLTCDDNGDLWGSPKQLKRKLLHNFAFVNQSLMTNKDPQYSSHYKLLKETFYLLRDDLLHIFDRHEYQQYFEQRLRDGYIMRCHGDLKARNIWIAPCNYRSNEEPWKSVSILDAIDFNPMYSNIDILSDFAMLVVDVQARTKSSALANFMIDEYLRLTRQQDKASRSVLTYYLVEKAFVGAIVNIIYDSLPLLGQSFLEVAKTYMEELKSRLRNSSGK